MEQSRVNEALQYGQTAGQKGLLKNLATMMYELHGRQIDPTWGISITAGSQEALYKTFVSLINPGDVVLIEVS